ncbi:hypothetical protein TH3_07170 [Thalassospira xiamenensis M-5 = DSM 17429]|uniref:Transposase n=1 Tax=Thalassospira xiamenensis M-5 = DSM 17429 TaxID=1123366 RepID=A0AB72UBM0_9PROT|nr:hypothetical protein TH3_07170 [Thalassospira xiamenensis M-5 = DSM 17429]
MAGVIFANSDVKSLVRDANPHRWLFLGFRKYNTCPSDQSDLQGLLCRKTLKDIYLPAILLRVSAQI